MKEEQITPNSCNHIHNSKNNTNNNNRDFPNCSESIIGLERIANGLLPSEIMLTVCGVCSGCEYYNLLIKDLLLSPF